MKTTSVPIVDPQFDYLVRVEREDGAAAEAFVSGGTPVREATERRLAANLPTRFTLRLDLGNDAMSSPVDVSSVLLKVADLLSEWGGWPAETATPLGCSGALRDDNGNLVGKWHAYI